MEGAQCSSETRFHSAAYQLQGRASALWLRSTPSDPHERGHSAAALAKALDAQGTGSTRDVDHRGGEREESDVSRKCVAGQSHCLSHTLAAERRAHRVRKRAHAHTQKGRKEAVRSAWRSGEEGKPRRWSPEADGRSCKGAPHQPRVPRERHLVLRGLLVWAGAALPLRVTAGSSCQSRGPSESLGTSERVGASLAPIASNVAALRCASAEHA